MIAGTVLAVLLAAVVAAYIVIPLVRDGNAAAEETSSALNEELELESRQQMLLSALKDLEDDRQTDKIDEADYERLKARLSSQAIEVMQRLEKVSKDREASEELARKKAEPLRYPGAAQPDRST